MYQPHWWQERIAADSLVWVGKRLYSSWLRNCMKLIHKTTSFRGFATVHTGTVHAGQQMGAWSWAGAGWWTGSGLGLLAWALLCWAGIRSGYLIVCLMDHGIASLQFWLAFIWVGIGGIKDILSNILDLKVCLKSVLHIWDVNSGFENLFDEDGLELSDVMVFESSLNELAEFVSDFTTSLMDFLEIEKTVSSGLQLITVSSSESSSLTDVKRSGIQTSDIKMKFLKKSLWKNGFWINLGIEGGVFWLDVDGEDGDFGGELGGFSGSDSPEKSGLFLMMEFGCNGEEVDPEASSERGGGYCSRRLLFIGSEVVEQVSEKSGRDQLCPRIAEEAFHRTGGVRRLCRSNLDRDQPLSGNCRGGITSNRWCARMSWSLVRECPRCAGCDRGGISSSTWCARVMSEQIRSRSCFVRWCPIKHFVEHLVCTGVAEQLWSRAGLSEMVSDGCSGVAELVRSGILSNTWCAACPLWLNEAGIPISPEFAITLGTCNKPFKPQGYPGGRVKSREGL
ncbi:hypothetical protein LXL04_005775 [Taraxacum kok-saghyz]